MEVDTEELCGSSTDCVNGSDEKTPNNDDEECKVSGTIEEDVTRDCQNGTQSEADDASIGFKKPVLLVGPKRGKGGKVRVLESIKQDTAPCLESVEVETEPTTTDSSTSNEIDPKQPPSNAKDIPLPYTEPSWSGILDNEYKLEVLKSGMIIETIELNKKSFHVIGRLPACNIALAHPTISRYHAILQFRVTGDEKNPSGLYLYDLGSTHGSYWNGNRIRPNVYVRVQGGHMLRFGCSQRKFILQAPEEDQEDESELTVTELKEQRMLELQEREKAEKERLLWEEEMKQKKEKEENEGIDWGMGEDADEDTDLTENPYATPADEELYLDDPKKTLRGWFEREGYELQYQTEEKGIGQFLCWVDLPIEGVTGHSVRAEALVKGKKKESVVQCALEACRILDRHGLLRQANHEARKRKTRNWEEEDFYDSDEDNFLDRTGTVEKKRELRMRQAGKLETKIETYSTLMEKHEDILKKIAQLEEKIEKSKNAQMSQDDTNEDALDAFMSSLSSSVLTKSDIRKMKVELQNLHKEEERLLELVNLARPANLPPLLPRTENTEKSSPEKSRAQTNKTVGVVQKKKPQTSPSKEEKDSSHSIPDCSNTPEEVDSEGDEKTDTDNNIDSTSQEQNSTKITVGETEETTHQETEETHSKEQHNQTLEKNDKSEGEKSKKELKPKKASTKSKKDSKKSGKHKELDMYKDDYSMWVPPTGQTGDGKTSLNEKYGY